METKIRVIDRPIATDSEGKVLEVGVSWYPSQSLDSKVYDSCLVGGSRPYVQTRPSNGHDDLVRVARDVVRRDWAIFRALG